LGAAPLQPLRLGSLACGRKPPAPCPDTATAALQPELVQKLDDSEYNISMENHMYGVLPHFHDRWPILKEW
jgi:hypothetical protein